jgi:hypothetical protein
MAVVLLHLLQISQKYQGQRVKVGLQEGDEDSTSMLKVCHSKMQQPFSRGGGGSRWG